MAKKYPGGIRIDTPLNIATNKPVSDDQVLELVSDLFSGKYTGNVAYVLETDTLYVKESTGWKPVGSKKTIQTINSGGNYNALEVTGDFLVFTNENAQAIINGVYGKVQFKIINLSTTYEVKINDKSPSVTGLGKQINLPTSSGSVGVRGSAEIIQIDANNFYVSDVWGSKYRPEFKGLTKKQISTIDEFATAGVMETNEFIVYLDAQATPLSKAELNAAYATAKRPFQVVCNLINLIYFKVDDNTNSWKSIPLTTVV